MRPLGFSALWALAQLCVFVHEAKANASDQLLFDAAACTSIRTKAIDTLQRLSTETDEGVDFIDSMARSWREFLLTDLVDADFCRTTQDTFDMGHLMPIFSTAYAHVGQLVCPVCTRVVNTMRARLRELVESPLPNPHTPLTDEVLMVLIDRLIPTSLCAAFVPDCDGTMQSDTAAVDDDDEPEISDQLMATIQAIFEKFNIWSLFFGKFDAAGDLPYNVDPDATYKDTITCVGCTVCKAVSDLIYYTIILDEAARYKIEQQLNATVTRTCNLLCTANKHPAECERNCADVFDKLVADVINAFFGALGNFFVEGHICDELHFCNSARKPYAYTEADLLRCVQDACVWLTRLPSLKWANGTCPYFPKSHDPPPKYRAPPAARRGDDEL